jgi:hypothetical protein
MGVRRSPSHPLFYAFRRAAILGSGKVRLGSAADGTDPIFGQIFKSGAGGDAAVRVAGGGIIFIATHIANIFLHR